MNWRTTKEGDRRTVRRFAWFPAELSNGRTIWLERYETLEEAVLMISWAAAGGFAPHWQRSIGWKCVEARQ